MNCDIFVYLLKCKKPKYPQGCLGSNYRWIWNLFAAIIYALYKPNVEGDDKKISQILSGAKKIFSLIGALMFGIAAIVAYIVPFFIKDFTFDYMYIVVAFTLFSLSNIVAYFFVPYTTLYEVKEKKYVKAFGYWTYTDETGTEHRTGIFEKGKEYYFHLEICIL